MRVGESHGSTGRKARRGLVGWILAASLVAVAVFGPPLTGQSIPTLVELRHDILTIDREFERLSMRTRSSFQTGAFVREGLGRGSISAGPRATPRGGVW